MQKLSSFGQGKKIRPKKSLTRLLQEALQLIITHCYSQWRCICWKKRKGQEWSWNEYVRTFYCQGCIFTAH